MKTGKPHSEAAAVIQERKGVGLGQVRGRSSAKKRKHQKMARGKKPQKNPHRLAQGQKRKEGSAGSQILGESGGAATLQE